jgi:hypothetical protein
VEEFLDRRKDLTVPIGQNKGLSQYSRRIRGTVREAVEKKRLLLLLLLRQIIARNAKYLPFAGLDRNALFERKRRILLASN